MKKKAYIVPETVCIKIASANLLAGSYTQSTDNLTTEDTGGELGARGFGLWEDDAE